MKKTLFLAAGAALVAGVLLSQTAFAGIVSTKHNLGSTGTGANKFSGTAEICVFCHTPHGTDTSASVALWNRTLAAPASYTTYDSLGTSTLDGKVTSVGSVSIACLSCHDGTQAMNVVLNAPGSGATNATYSAGTWTGTGTLSSGIVSIGTDLKNDHPIGIQYGGGGIKDAAGSLAGPMKDIDFIAPANAQIGSGARVWWVDTAGGAANTREKTDMLLYTRSDAGIDSGAAQPFVECASCHDPHTSAAPTFLRISNAGSAVCLACHTK